MIEAGAVGARFTILDEASPVLRALMSQFIALQSEIDRTKTALLGLRMPPGISKGIAGLDEALAAAAKSAGLLDDSLVGIGASADKGTAAAVAGFGRLDESIGITQGKVARLREEMLGLKVPGSGGSRTIGPGGESLPHGVGGGGRGGMGHSAFHLGAHERFGPLAVRGVGDSSIPLAVGFGGLFASYEAEKQAFDVAQADNNLRNMKVSEDKIAQANAAALSMSAWGVSQVDALNMIRTTSVPLNTGGTSDTGVDAAMAVLPQIAKFNQLARSLKGEEGGDASRQVFELIKAGELRQKLTPDEMSQSIADYAKVYQGTGGKVTPQMFYAGLKYAKSARCPMNS